MKTIILLLALTFLCIHEQASVQKCIWEAGATAYALIKKKNSNTIDSTAIIYCGYGISLGAPYLYIDTLNLNVGDSFRISIDNKSEYDNLDDRVIRLINGEITDSSFVNGYDGGEDCNVQYSYRVYNPDNNQLLFKSDFTDSTLAIPVKWHYPTSIISVPDKESITVNNKIIVNAELSRSDNVKAVFIYDIAGRACKINSAVNNNTNFSIDAALPDDNMCILRIITDTNSFSYKFISY